ncbi:uncharacterized protein [Henckelia pumila]|uniref:uncharacterized protein n=1 Tax=Henckelia pumila TaxID=405737 RepID=UPI003C6E7E12
MRDLDECAADWFNDKIPNQWSRSHVTDFSKCDMLLNNGCESFNSSILEARDKPILSMCEWIIEYLMKRMQVNRDTAEQRWAGSFCPKIQKVIDQNFAELGDCISIKSDNFHYQVSCHDGRQYSVDLKNGTCGCRKWDLSGIPCKHALSAIDAQRLDYYEFTHKYYRVDYYRMVYAPAIMPINGRDEWNPTDQIPPMPPNVGRFVGRPKKQGGEKEMKLKRGGEKGKEEKC